MVADVVVGLGWGDEGKGITTAALVERNKAAGVVRFNGGQQAAHNVVIDNMHHTFSTFGSGSFFGAKTLISQYCTFSPQAAAAEYESLSKKVDIEENLFVHEDASVTTLLHIMVNHRREQLRGNNRHGSTGTGFGETIQWRFDGKEPLLVKDLKDSKKVKEWLHWYYKEQQSVGLLPLEGEDYFVDEAYEMATRFNKYQVISEDYLLSFVANNPTVFEGAQGFMLDEDFGDMPHVTWSKTLADNAKNICLEAGIDYKIWGCMRTFATRHGDGPFPGECDMGVKELHNQWGEYQGHFRFGKWDFERLQWSFRMVEPDYLAISWADRFEKVQTTQREMPFDELPIPVGLVGYGMDVRERTWLL